MLETLAPPTLQGARNPGKGAPPSRFLRHRPHPALGCPGQPSHFLLRWGLHPRTCWAGARADGAGWIDSGQPPAISPFWRFWSRSRFRPNPVRPWGARSGGRGGEPQPGGQDADPALLPPAVAQRKPWLVGLGAALAFLFLVFVLAVVYAVWCSESRDRWAPNSRNPPSLSLAPLCPALSKPRPCRSPSLHWPRPSLI